MGAPNLRELDAWLSNPLLAGSKLFQVGDINLNFLAESNDKMTCSYLNILHSRGLAHTINTFTREEFWDGELVRACLDHININFNNPNFQSFVVKERISDHHVTGFLLKDQNTIITDLHPEKHENRPKCRIILDKEVTKRIRVYDWSILICNDHILTYNNLVEKFNEIYEQSSRVGKFLMILL